MVRIGIIGCGGIARGKHIPELLKVTDAKITALCDIDEKALALAASKAYVDEAHRFTDWHELIASPDVDAVEICTPNYLHLPMALAAIAADKAVEIEKPLGLPEDDMNTLAEALAKHPVPNMTCFSYRFFPAVRYAKWILDKHLIGDVIDVHAEYLKSSAFWEGRKLDWRFEKQYAGSGVLGDLGAHLVDAMQLLASPVTSISANVATVVKQREKTDGSGLGAVTTDDYCAFLATLENGANATFRITRCAIGHANTIRFDILGTEGVVSFDLNHPDRLNVCIGEVDKRSDGLHTVTVPAGFQVTQEQTFVDTILGKAVPFVPTVADGIRTQKVLNAAYLSASERRFVDVR